MSERYIPRYSEADRLKAISSYLAPEEVAVLGKIFEQITRHIAQQATKVGYKSRKDGPEARIDALQEQQRTTGQTLGTKDTSSFHTAIGTNETTAPILLRLSESFTKRYNEQNLTQLTSKEGRELMLVMAQTNTIQRAAERKGIAARESIDKKQVEEFIKQNATTFSTKDLPPELAEFWAQVQPSAGIWVVDHQDEATLFFKGKNNDLIKVPIVPGKPFILNGRVYDSEQAIQPNIQNFILLRRVTREEIQRPSDIDTLYFSNLDHHFYSIAKALNAWF